MNLSSKTCLQRRLSALLLSAAVLFVALLSGTASLFQTAQAAQAVQDEGSIRSPKGLFVTVMDNRDFPSSNQVTERYLKAQIDRITQAAAQNGFNTIFLETTLLGEAVYSSKLLPPSRFLSRNEGFDPLSYWISSAKEQGLEVVAVANLFLLKRPKDILTEDGIAGLHPEYTLQGADGSVYLNPANPQAQKLAVKAVSELLTSYGVRGVLLENYQLPDSLAADAGAVQDALTKILKDIHSLEAAAKKSVGITIDHLSAAYADGAKPGFTDPGSWIVQNLADYLLIDNVLTAEDGYGQELSYWLSMAQASGTRVYSFNDGERLLSPSSGSRSNRRPKAR